MNHSPISSKKILKRFLSYLLVPFLITWILFFYPQPNQAASGGRIGGGQFRTPSIPRSGNYRRSFDGYRTPYRGGYGGRGIGFPFLLPIFGFGGGGLFGFLLIIAISGVIVNTFRGSSYTPQATNNSINNEQFLPKSVTMVQLQMGLLASAKEIQKNLRKLANSSDTSTSEGLKNVLQETTLALLRKPDLWVYANTEVGTVPFQSAESTFSRLSINERSKLTSEITSNFSGKIGNSYNSKIIPGEADATNEFIAITILIATTNQISFNNLFSNEQLQKNLRIMGSIPSKDLLALEIIWQPEGEGEVLSSNELVTSYPNLKHL